jgi:hypothetical protein
MEFPATCPMHGEINVRIDHLEKKYDRICKNKNKCDEKFKSVHQRIDGAVTMKLFAWVFGILVVILLAVFGGIYSQGRAIEKNQNAMAVDMAGIKASLGVDDSRTNTPRNR